MASWLPYVCLFAVSLATSLAVTPVARRIALAIGAVDRPDSRRINRKPIPRMGGIAIFMGIVAAFALQYIGTTFWGWPVVLVPSHHLQVNYWELVASFVVIFAVGLADDIFSLKPLIKFLGQIVAACIAVHGGLVIGVIVNPATINTTLNLGWLAYPITVVYLVAYVNIINLIDGMDGLAAGISCIASFTMFVLALWAQRLDSAVLAIAVVGSSLGFLRYNFHPASIFMGDSGSHVLGFSLGVISLLSVTRVVGLTTIIVPLVIAGIPILDTFSAIVRRTRAHVSVSHADRGHIHHRLLAEGYNQRQTVLMMYAWTALLCLGALVMTQLEILPRIIVFVALLAASVAFTVKLRLFEPVLLHYYNPKTGEDELVCPDDTVFEEALEQFEDEHGSIFSNLHADSADDA